MRKVWVLFYLLIAVTASARQRDSLLQIVKIGTSPQKLTACKELASLLKTKDFAKSIEYAGQGIGIAATLKDSTSIAELHNIIGEAYYFKGNYDIAAQHIFTAIYIFERHHQDAHLANALNSIAKLYRKTRDLEKAEAYYDKAMQIFSNLRDTTGLEMISNESGVVFEYRGDYKEAIRRYMVALHYAKAKGNSSGMGYALNNISGSLLLQGKYVEAAEHLNKALQIRKEIKDSFAMAINYSDIGTLYDSLKQYKIARAYFDSSNQIALKLHYVQLLANNYEVQSSIAKQVGDINAAYDYFIRADAIKDSLYAIDKLAQVEQLNTQYQTEKKERQIHIQQLEISRRNYIILGIMLLVIMSSTLSYSYYRRYKIRQQQRLQEAIMHQQQLAIQAVLEAEESERQRIGQDLHDGVGQMMSAVKINLSTFRDRLVFEDEQQHIAYDNLISLVDESCKEVRSISHNMMPNALLKAGLASAIRDFLTRIDNRVLEVNLYTEGLNERLNTDTETVLYRVIQECVNNVIKHAAAKRLDISIIKDAEGISATVEDNGRGFDTTRKDVFEGIGLKNISTRIEYLKGTVDFDSRPGYGTVVAINIPYSAWF